jgi:hypothetical protein
MHAEAEQPVVVVFDTDAQNPQPELAIDAVKKVSFACALDAQPRGARERISPLRHRCQPTPQRSCAVQLAPLAFELESSPLVAQAALPERSGGG